MNFCATVCKTIRPICYRTVVCQSVCLVMLVYCGQTVGRIKMPLGTKLGLGPGHIVLDGDPAPQKGARSPLFSAHVYCGQTVAHLGYLSLIHI